MALCHVDIQAVKLDASFKLSGRQSKQLRSIKYTSSSGRAHDTMDLVRFLMFCLLLDFDRDMTKAETDVRKGGRMSNRLMNLVGVKVNINSHVPNSKTSFDQGLCPIPH